MREAKGGSPGLARVVYRTYRIALWKTALFFQPDIQYVINPGGGHNLGNALVLGCQIGFNF